MGKSRKTKIKRLGDEILEYHAEHFTTNFIENKKMVAEVAISRPRKFETKSQAILRILSMHESMWNKECRHGDHEEPVLGEENKHYRVDYGIINAP